MNCPRQGSICVTRFAKTALRWTAVFVVLLGLLLIAYGPALRGGLIWDDEVWTNRISMFTRDWHGLWLMWSMPAVLQQYYPLTGTSFWVDHQLWGGWTMPYHVENVLLHGLCALLFGWLLRCLKVPGAVWAALIFAFHPMMVESVAWITERKNVLSLVFFLAALLAYGRHVNFWEETGVETKQQPGMGWYGAALILFVAALLAKITAFALPVVIVVLAWWKRGRVSWVRDIEPMAPFGAIALVLGLGVRWLEAHHAGAEGGQFAYTLVDRLLIAGHALWFYPLQLCWPQSLSFIYPAWSLHPASLIAWLWPIAALGVLAGAFMWRKRLGRGIFAAMALYGLTLFPVSGMLNVHAMCYSFVWDHWAYVSSLPIIALLTALIAQAAHRWGSPRLAASIMVLVVGFLAWRTHKEAAQYQSPETLWSSVIQRNPTCWLAWERLGARTVDLGQAADAEPYLQRALSLRADYPEAIYDLGRVQQMTGRPNDAAASFRRALALLPKMTEAHYALGTVLAGQGNWEDAVHCYADALDLWSGHPEAHQKLAEALVHLGRKEQAVQEYQRAALLYPDNVAVQKQLAHLQQPSGMVTP